MRTEDLCFMPAVELAGRIRRREVSPREVVETFLQRIEERNPALNAYVTLLPERARAQAVRAEAALTAGEPLGPLHGVPIAIKDLMDMLAGVPNTFGCRVFADFIPDVTATYVERLEAAGAIVLGKTNTPEFGHKGVTDNLLFGPTHNPFAPGKNAGGSSGGSAAALAAGLAALAQGSDAGGSIRIPASCCGVYGLKASFGRVPAVSRPDGFVSHTPFLHAGPMARTVGDAALMLSVMAGPHPGDPFSLPDEGVDYLAAAGASGPLRIAFSPDLDVFPVDPEVDSVVRQAALAFEQAGAVVEEVKLGLERSQRELSDLWLDQMGVLYASMAAGFAAQGIDLLGSYRDQLAPEFVALLERGRAMDAVGYKSLDGLRTEVYDAVQAVFEGFDLLISPTLAALPFDNAADGGTLGPSEVNGESVDPTIGWCMTYPFNFTPHPAASAPAGLSSQGLPVGLQIVGRRFDDAGVLAASAALEAARPWAHHYPG